MYIARRCIVEVQGDVGAASGDVCPRGNGILKVFKKFESDDPAEGELTSIGGELVPFFNPRKQSLKAGDVVHLIQLVDEVWVVRCPCPVGSSSSSSVSSSSGGYCPANLWETEWDTTGCTSQETDDALAAVPMPDGDGSGWSFRALVKEVGPGGAPITYHALYQCCDGKPTGPAGPSSGTAECDDLYIDGLFDDFVSDNSCITGHTSNTGFFGSYCATQDLVDGLNDWANDLSQDDIDNGLEREVLNNNGCLNCCGNELFEEVEV